MVLLWQEVKKLKKVMGFLAHITYALLNALVIPRLAVPMSNIKIVNYDKWDKTVFLSVSYAVSILMIYLLWNHFFAWFQRKSNVYKKLFLCFTIFVQLQYIVLFPSDYILWGDNGVILGVAENGYPMYWHNYMTSVYTLVTCICFGSPLFIGIIQGVVYCLILSYICEYLYQRNKKAMYMVALTLLAYCHFWGTNPYRMFLYGMLLMYLLAKTWIETENGAFYKTANILFNSALAGFLAFFRTESVLYLFFVVIMLGLKRDCKKKLLIMSFLISILIYVILSIPQKIGNDKHYGNDYLLLSMYGLTSNVLYYDAKGDRLANTEYEGAEEQIKGLLIDRESIEKYGSYVHHYWCGTTNQSVSQSAFTKEESRKIIKNSILLSVHNIPLILRERFMGLSWIFHTSLWKSTPYCEDISKNCRESKDYNEAIHDYIVYGKKMEQSLEGYSGLGKITYISHILRKNNLCHVIWLFIAICSAMYVILMCYSLEFLKGSKKMIGISACISLIYALVWSCWNIFHVYMLIAYIAVTALFICRMVKYRRKRIYLISGIYTLISFLIALFFSPFPNYYYFSPVMQSMIVLTGLSHPKMAQIKHNRT